jgi:hypothetical protein
MTDKGRKMNSRVRAILGPEAGDLLGHQCRTISRDMLHLPGPAFVAEFVSLTDRTPRVLRNLQAVFDHGRLAGTALINKRAGGTGLIPGRKAFPKPREEGVELLHAVQDVYLDEDITVA